jgi:hypothetical protein
MPSQRRLWYCVDMAKAAVLRFAACLMVQSAIAFSCAFPSVDRIGKACETSCEPYYCVDRVCQRDPAAETDSEPKDATPPRSDREDAVRPMVPCNPVELEAGRPTVRLFRDCFDDRTAASGLNTPWPGGSGAPILDPSASVSTPNSVLFQQDAAGSNTINTGFLPTNTRMFSQIFCSMRVRFDGITTLTKFVQFDARESTIPVFGEEVSLSVYSLGGALRWKMFRKGADGGILVDDVAIGSDGREWQPLTILLTTTQLRVQIGNSRHESVAGTTVPMLGVGLGLGFYVSDEAPRSIRFDDVACEGVPN